MGMDVAAYWKGRVRTLKMIDECNNSPKCIEELTRDRKIAHDRVKSKGLLSQSPSSSTSSESTSTPPPPLTSDNSNSSVPSYPKLEYPSELSPSWIESFGGNVEIYKKEREQIVKSIDKCNNNPACLEKLDKARKLAKELADKFKHKS